MSSIIKFQAISGAFDEKPLCYLLQIDEFRFLLDCGWNDSFTPELIEEYKNLKPHAILLSYADTQHLGALPYLVGKCGLTCPIYATIPVIRMGQMFMYDLYLAHSSQEDFNLFTLNDIDVAFDKIEQLKYSQTVNLTDNGFGLQITALPAGHMIGGTIWRILKDGEEEFIYATDYNHHIERHLNSCALDLISKPTLLITDAFNVLQAPKRRSQNEKLLVESILKTFRNSGNVLVCTDTAGRVLELAILLDQLWAKQDLGLLAYSICLLNSVSISVADFAKSMVEWMNDKIVRSFEEVRNNPFQFAKIVLCKSIEELDNVPNPKLVLASTPDMQYGFSRDIFLKWCDDEKNLVIFTQRPNDGTLGKQVLDLAGETRSITIDIKRKVPLEGIELDEYYDNLAKKSLIKDDPLSKNLESIDIGSSSSDDDADDDIATLGPLNGDTKHDIMKIAESKAKSGFFKHTRKIYPMFPFREELIKWDDYGQIIKPEEFTRGAELAHEQVNENRIKREDEEMAVDMKKEIDETPCKFINEEKIFSIKIRSMYIDFEGRSDGDSIKKIISSIKPKNMIIVHGTEKATVELARYCKQAQIVQDTISTPRVGEIVDATSETQIYQVKLKDNIVSDLKFYKSKDYELAWINGIIKVKNRGSNADLDITNINIPQSALDLEYGLHPLNKEQLALIKRKVVFVNEPKLSDLKQILVKNGYQAEFHGGVLVCEGRIALRKNEAGRIILEGVVSDDYYGIRQILYDEYAII